MEDSREKAGKRGQRISPHASMAKYEAARTEGEHIDSTSASHYNYISRSKVFNNLAALAGLGGGGNAAGSIRAPGGVPWDDLSDSWLGERLREAVADNDANFFKLLLHELLAKIGAYPPPREAFTPWPKKVGRPQNLGIIKDWINQECPFPDKKVKDALIRVHYPDEYQKAVATQNPTLKGRRLRELRNRVGSVLDRYRKRATKPQPIS